MWGFTPRHHVFTTQGAIVPKVQEAFAPYRGYKAPSREKKWYSGKLWFLVGEFLCLLLFFLLLLFPFFSCFFLVISFVACFFLIAIAFAVVFVAVVVVVVILLPVPCCFLFVVYCCRVFFFFLKRLLNVNQLILNFSKTETMGTTQWPSLFF